MLEPDPDKLQQRIMEAQRAIRERIDERLTGPSDGEFQLMNDALYALGLLLKEYAKRSSPPNSPDLQRRA